MSEPGPQLISEEELAAILAAAILDGKGGRMSRDAEGYLAGVCADYLVDRMVMAGVVAVRNIPRIAGRDGLSGDTAVSSACGDIPATAMLGTDDNLSAQGNRDR